MPTIPIPEPLREVVAEALRNAVEEFMQPSVHHTAALNTIGCYLLCHLTSFQYEPIAGSIDVRQGGNPLTLRADPARIDEHEYYLWIERPLDDGRIELIDFASSCWQEWAKDESALWLGGPPPAFVWAHVDEIDTAIVRYKPDAEITNIVRTALHNVFRSEEQPEQVKQWEAAINTSLDVLVNDPRAIDFLVDAGIAER